MSKFTPGPWLKSYRRGYRVFVEYEGGDEIDRELIARVSGPEANAQLISAAPDMYEALKEVVRLSDRDHKAWDAARAALAKAEGRS